MMVIADVPAVPSRSIVAYVLAIIAVIVAVSVTILILLAWTQSALIESASIAGDYHLTATARASVVEHHLWAVDRRTPRSLEGAVAILADRRVAASLQRVVHLIEREMQALEVAQRKYAGPTFEAPLRRLLDQSDRFALAISTRTGNEPANTAIMRERLDQFRLRLDQFSDLHWKAYVARDTSFARASGSRRFVLLSSIVSLAALILIGIATRQIITTLREQREAERLQRLLRIELDHRVKNNLSSVLSLARQTAHSSSDLDDFVSVFTDRLLAMARTHEALAALRWSEISLDRLASLALAPQLEAAPCPITIEGDSVVLPATTALPLCLTLHELSTNATKHGALSRSAGRVSLTWENHDRCVDLSWVEHGGPVVIEPKSTGLGMQLIEGFVRHELRGDVAVDYRPEGLACRMSVPLSGDRTD